MYSCSPTWPKAKTAAAPSYKSIKEAHGRQAAGEGGATPGSRQPRSDSARTRQRQQRRTLGPDRVECSGVQCSRAQVSVTSLCLKTHVLFLPRRSEAGHAEVDGPEIFRPFDGRDVALEPSTPPKGDCGDLIVRVACDALPPGYRGGGHPLVGKGAKVAPCRLICGWWRRKGAK